MAVTKIWPIRSSLSSVITYAGNEEKTRIPDLTGLETTLAYAANESKTVQEEQLFVSGVNCVPEIALQQMEMTKQRYSKTDGTVAFHAYQSFPPGEVTPQQCHEIGVKLAQRLWGGRFEVLIATHLNTDCCHNHFVINSVSFADGKRYNDCKATYREFRKASDTLCQEYGLSIVEPQSAARTPRNIYLAEKRGEPTRYNIMREDIDRAVSKSKRLSDVYYMLRSLGYVIVNDPNRKYATIRMPSDKYATRFKTLGENYSEEALRSRLGERSIPRSPMQTEFKSLRDFTEDANLKRRNRRELLRRISQQQGIQKLYLYYGFFTGKDLEFPERKIDYSERWKSIWRTREMAKQFSLLKREHITSKTDLAEAIVTRQHMLKEQISYRNSCYNRLRRCKDPEKIEEIKSERDDISAKITELRTEIRHLYGVTELWGSVQQEVERCEQRLRGIELER